MNEQEGRDELLEDVLKDEKLEALRQRVLRRSRKELALKRRSPFRWWMVPAAAAAVFLLVELWNLVEVPGPSVIDEMEPRPYYVHTVPLSQDRLVRTRPLDEIKVSTKEISPAVRITDEEMLAIFEGVPCGLIQRGDRKVLVFPRPEDEERFFKDLGG